MLMFLAMMVRFLYRYDGTNNNNCLGTSKGVLQDYWDNVVV